MKSSRLPVKIAAMLLLLSLVLQGCSGSAVKASATDELVICIDAHFYAMLKSLIRDYTDTYPKVKMTFEIVQRDDSIFSPLIDEDYKFTTLRRLQTEIMSGNGPDLFILDAGYYGECFFQDINKVIRNGVFCDLLPLLRDAGITEEGFIQPVFDAGKVNGKQYIAPLEYQVCDIITNEASRKNMGTDQIVNTTDLLAAIRTAIKIPGTGVHPYNFFDMFHFDLNPYYYAAKPLIDYDANTIQIDTPLTRDVLETGRLVTDKIKEYSSESLQPLTRWSDYLRSHQFLNFYPYFLAIAQESVLDGFSGITANLDPIPSEAGGVCAVISSFAGIRANSENKINAVNLIKLLLSEEYQIRKNGQGFAYPNEGYPVLKGVLEKRLLDLVPRGLYMTFGSTYFTFSQTRMLDENIQMFLQTESEITAARFPTPREVNDILTQYYTGEIDLDTALLKMQEYWEMSLWE